MEDERWWGPSDTITPWHVREGRERLLLLLITAGLKRPELTPWVAFHSVEPSHFFGPTRHQGWLALLPQGSREFPGTNLRRGLGGWVDPIYGWVIN